MSDQHQSRFRGELAAGATPSARPQWRAWFRIFELAVGSIASALLLLFAIAPGAPPPNADSTLISSPQSIGGRS